MNAILDSPEIARRHILHYNKMPLPSDVEVIFVDDGSNPPLSLDGVQIDFKFSLYATGNKKRWTQPAARNLGSRKAKGEFCIFTDIDHIITKEAVEVARNPQFDVIRFKRKVAILDEEGNFSQDHDELARWGLLPQYFKKRLRLPPHGNSYIFQRELYLRLGGVDERFVGTGRYPNREEVPLKKKLKALRDRGEITICDDDNRPIIYMFPNGKYCGDKDYNPFGFFHNTSRKNNKEKRKSKTSA